MTEKGTINCAELLKNGCMEDYLRGSGIYRVKILKEAYKPHKHGPSPIIHIGKAGSKDWGLSSRIGYFIAGALGFIGTRHSVGQRFFDVHDELEINVKHLEIEWVICENADQREIEEFDEFTAALTADDQELLHKVRHEILEKYDELRIGIDKLYPLLSQRRG